MNSEQITVSIIMPAFNSQNYISESIESVLNQTLSNWELVIVNDMSSDSTEDIIKKYTENDARIKLYNLTENSGTAIARNEAIKYSKGKYIAFLDSDDIWLPMKLERQINFMEKHGYEFTCTSYNKIDENGYDLNIKVSAYSHLDYEGILKECPGNSTVVYNAQSIGKIIIPPIRKRNDYLMWLKVIKKSNQLVGMKETLSSHRVHKESLSNNKLSLIKYHWKIYREYEKLNIIQSISLIRHWALKTIKNHRIFN